MAEENRVTILTCAAPPSGDLIPAVAYSATTEQRRSVS